MVTLLKEDVVFHLPLGDRYILSVEADMDVYGEDMSIEDYRIEDLWNQTHEREATIEEYKILGDFIDEIGSGIDWQRIYFEDVEDSDYYEDDCND